jgi:hypothetical protein
MKSPGGLVCMRALDEHVLKVTKEIVAKFIEVGRVSPASFDETFKNVYRSVKEAILDHNVEEEE